MILLYIWIWPSAKPMAILSSWIERSKVLGINFSILNSFNFFPLGTCVFTTSPDEDILVKILLFVWWIFKPIIVSLEYWTSFIFLNLFNICISPFEYPVAIESLSWQIDIA